MEGQTVSIVTDKAISAELVQNIYYKRIDGKLSCWDKNCLSFRGDGEYQEKLLGLYTVTFERSFKDRDGETVVSTRKDLDFWALKGSDVVATWQKLQDEYVKKYGELRRLNIEDGKIDLADWDAQMKKKFELYKEYLIKLKEEYGCKVKCYQDGMITVVDGKEIIFYVNDNGAIIEIGEVRPNTFEDGFYYDNGCTVDIDINVYNDDFSVKFPFTLYNVDTKITCYDWFDDFWEGELECILEWEDENGNYDGPEEDKEFYLAAKKCQENGWDFLEKYNWEKFRTEEDFEAYCWDLITNTDYTSDQMAALDEIKKGIPRIENSKGLYVAVDAEGTFQVYDCGVQLGDDLLYGDTLFEGSYTIKGIKKGTGKEMKDRIVNALCKWAKENGYESHNYVNIDTYTLEYGEKEYLSNLQEPIVEIVEE